MIFFAFSIKLIWLGVGFLNRTGAQKGYGEIGLKEIGTFYNKNPKNTASAQLWDSHGRVATDGQSGFLFVCQSDRQAVCLFSDSKMLPLMHPWPAVFKQYIYIKSYSHFIHWNKEMFRWYECWLFFDKLYTTIIRQDHIFKTKTQDCFARFS